jgi:hypothetical protein
LASPAEHGGLETKLVPAKGFRVYRAWRIIKYDGEYTLLSMNNKKWDSKKLEAECKTTVIAAKRSHPKDEPIPGASCACGIYGRYLSDDLDDVGIYYSHQHLYVIGSVLLSGLVDHGERGARGQYATMEAIVPAYGINPIFRQGNGERWNDVIRATVARYQIQSFKNMEDLIAQYPEEDTSFLDQKRALAEAQRQAEEAANARAITDMYNGLTLTPAIVERIRNWVPPPNSSANIYYYSTTAGSNPASNDPYPIVTYNTVNYAEIEKLLAANILAQCPCPSPTCPGKKQR